MRRRESSRTASVEFSAPAFDPAHFVREPREGFDAWTLHAAAVLYRMHHEGGRHGFDGPSRLLAEAWATGNPERLDPHAEAEP